MNDLMNVLPLQYHFRDCMFLMLIRKFESLSLLLST